jgi:diaminopimelate epimerase
MAVHTVKFQKWQGTGNDFIIPDRSLESLYPVLKAKASFLCDRRRGIGGDGILLLLPSKLADFKMVIINSDGSEPEMCGNGIRCLASYIRKQNISAKNALSIETGAGIIGIELLRDTMVKVTMGPPRLEASDIPVAGKTGRVIMEEFEIKGRTFKCTAVSMGNPHAVIYTERADDELVKEFGPLIEKHPLFPKKTNVEFITIVSDSQINMRVWERGCGETLACGTGACASVVSGILNKLHGNDVTVHLRGGALSVQWSGIQNDPVFLTGPATHVFDGTVEVDA